MNLSLVRADSPSGLRGNRTRPTLTHALAWLLLPVRAIHQGFPAHMWKRKGIEVREQEPEVRTSRRAGLLKKPHRLGHMERPSQPEPRRLHARSEPQGGAGHKSGQESELGDSRANRTWCEAHHMKFGHIGATRTLENSQAFRHVIYATPTQ